jgi:hypothetical protein
MICLFTNVLSFPFLLKIFKSMSSFFFLTNYVLNVGYTFFISQNVGYNIVAIAIRHKTYLLYN